MADTEAKISSAQLRKIKKPMIEKRRRERINESLGQVKALVLDALNKNESRFNKMEKADILEMTVKHLKTIHQQQQQDPGPGIIANRYKAGFKECADEVKRYLATVTNIKPDIHDRLMKHLDRVAQKSMGNIDHVTNSGNLSHVTRMAGTIDVEGVMRKENSTGSLMEDDNVLNTQTLCGVKDVPNLQTQSPQIPALKSHSDKNMLPSIPVRTISNETISIPVITADQLNISPYGIVTIMPPVENKNLRQNKDDEIRTCPTQINNCTTPCQPSRDNNITGSSDYKQTDHNNNSSCIIPLYINTSSPNCRQERITPSHCEQTTPKEAIMIPQSSQNHANTMLGSTSILSHSYCKLSTQKYDPSEPVWRPW